MMLEEVLHVLDEDEDEPIMAGSDEEFDVLEDIDIMKTRMKQIVGTNNLMILI